MVEPVGAPPPCPSHGPTLEEKAKYGKAEVAEAEVRALRGINERLEEYLANAIDSLKRAEQALVVGALGTARLTEEADEAAAAGETYRADLLAAMVAKSALDRETNGD